MEMRNRISETAMPEMKRFLTILSLLCLLVPTTSSAMVLPLPYAAQAASFQSTSLQPQSDYTLVPVNVYLGLEADFCRNDPVDFSDPLGLDENTVSISIPDDRSPLGSRIDVYQNTSAFYGCPQDTTGSFKPVVRKLEKNAFDIGAKSTVVIAKEMFEFSPLSSLYTTITGKDAMTGRKMKRAAGVIGLVTWVSPASRVEQKVANQAARVEASVAREAIVAAEVAKSVATPRGPAVQSMTAETQSALRQTRSGAPVYRAGGLGTQRAAEGQYWSFQNPASTPGYANTMGMPSTGPGEPFIMGGRVRSSASVITREAPGIGNSLGGSVEAVTQPGGVTVDWFHMP